MNNKKLSRLLEPNLKLYFLCMVLFCCAAAVVSPLLALAEAAVIVALYAYFTKANQKRRQGILQYIDSLTGSVDTASKSWSGPRAGAASRTWWPPPTGWTPPTPTSCGSGT